MNSPFLDEDISKTKREYFKRLLEWLMNETEESNLQLTTIKKELVHKMSLPTEQIIENQESIHKHLKGRNVNIWRDFSNFLNREYADTEIPEMVSLCIRKLGINLDLKMLKI